MQNLHNKLTTTLQESYENVKLEQVMSFGKPSDIGRILWAKNNWQPEWRFPKNAFKKMTNHFPKKILGSRILLT